MFGCWRRDGVFVERYACRIDVRYFEREVVCEFWVYLLDLDVLLDCFARREVKGRVGLGWVDGRCDALL